MSPGVCIHDWQDELLSRWGWSVDATSHEARNGAVVWQVEATRQGHRVMAWGQTRQDAYRAACRVVRRTHAPEDARRCDGRR